MLNSTALWQIFLTLIPGMFMRVLFIEKNLRNEKLGIMYLSASLKAHGHHADLVRIDEDDLDYKILHYQPDFVAFSITSGEHLSALSTARKIKRRYGISNIFGGPHCTFFPEIAGEEGVDHVVQGQGEQAILDIVEGRTGKGLYKADMAGSLDSFPFPDREIFYQFEVFRDNPMKNFITSRSCPYRCAYCYNHSQIELTKIDKETKEWFNRRSVDNVMEEIRSVREQYPLEKLNFIDDSFIQSKKWLIEFLQQYSSQVALPWLCSLRANCFNEDIAKQMHAAKLSMINYAIESVDPDVQQHILNRGNIKNQDILQAIKLFSQYGIRTRMQNMIGLPLANTLEDALNTLQFNIHHQVTDSWCSIFQPYPRTALGQYCLDHGFVSKAAMESCHESFFDRSILDIDNKNEIYSLQKLWYFIVDAKLPIDLVQILIRGKMDDQLANQIQQLRFECTRKKLYEIGDIPKEDKIRFSREDDLSNNTLQSDSTATVSAKDRTANLIFKALQKSDVPENLIKLISLMTFSEQELQQLERYNQGEAVYPPPLSTVNPETGELIDPEVSIYKRGVSDTSKMDILEITPIKFMNDMENTRNHYSAQP